MVLVAAASGALLYLVPGKQSRTSGFDPVVLSSMETNLGSDDPTAQTPGLSEVNIGDLTTRPLFDVTRGYDEPSANLVESDTVIQSEPIVLTQEDPVVFPFALYIGYTVFEDGVSALVQTSDSEQIWVSVGDVYEGWLVSAINLVEVGFTAGDRSEFLRRSY